MLSFSFVYITRHTFAIKPNLFYRPNKPERSKMVNYANSSKEWKTLLPLYHEHVPARSNRKFQHAVQHQRLGGLPNAASKQRGSLIFRATLRESQYAVTGRHSQRLGGRPTTASQQRTALTSRATLPNNAVARRHRYCTRSTRIPALPSNDEARDLGRRRSRNHGPVENRRRTPVANLLRTQFPDHLRS
jgi:hypothetical protein